MSDRNKFSVRAGSAIDSALSIDEVKSLVESLLRQGKRLIVIESMHHDYNQKRRRDDPGYNPDAAERA